MWTKILTKRPENTSVDVRFIVVFTHKQHFQIQCGHAEGRLVTLRQFISVKSPEDHRLRSNSVEVSKGGNYPLNSQLTTGTPALKS